MSKKLLKAQQESARAANEKCFGADDSTRSTWDDFWDISLLVWWYHSASKHHLADDGRGVGIGDEAE